MKINFTHAQQTDLPKIVATYNSTIESRLVTADLEPVSEGDSVEVFGPHISINQVAKWCDTISYEIMTGISQRVKREYYME